MEAHERENIRVGTILMDANNTLCRVKWSIYADGYVYPDGTPESKVQDNVVHYDEMEDDGNGGLQPVIERSFVHIMHLYGVPITEKLLRNIGFNNEDLNGVSVLKLNNAYFQNLVQSLSGHYTLRTTKGGTHLVKFIHEVQLHAAPKH